jgi:hypothetical protein
MADELARLIAIGGQQRPARRLQPRRAVVEAAAVADDAVAPVPIAAPEAAPAAGAAVVAPQPADDQGPGILVAMGEPPERKYAQRSWQLMQHVTSCRKLKRLEDKVEKAEGKTQLLQSKCEDVAATFPMVARAVGLPPAKRGPMTESRALVYERLALQPTLRGTSSFRNKQVEAVSIVCDAAMEVQDECRDRIFAPDVAAPPPPGLDVLLVPPPPKINVVCGQWDETSQKIKMLLVKKHAKEMTSDRQAGAQVMMQSYRMHTVVEGEITKSEPYYVRARILLRQTADFLAECLLQGMPWRIDNPNVIIELDDGCDTLILSFAFDRASNNWLLTSWIWSVLDADGMPVNVLPHGEPCSLHGWSLVERAPRLEGVKEQQNKIHSFALWMRFWKNAVAMKDYASSNVETRFEVREERRPPECKAQTEAIFNAVYPPDAFVEEDVDDPPPPKGRGRGRGRRRGGRGRRRKKKKTTASTSSLELVKNDMTKNVDLGYPLGRKFIHWCYVEEGSEEHKNGMRVGRPCCRDRPEALQKVQTPVLNWVSNRGYGSQVEGRWKFLVSMLRRIIIGDSAGGVWSESLVSVKAHFELDDGMEAFLAREIAADQNNFAAKGKLRLLKIVQVLCTPEARWRRVVMFIGLSTVERCVDKTLRERITLVELVGEVAECQEALLLLLERWGPDSEQWVLLRLVCGSEIMRDASIQMWSRSFIMQLSAAVNDHFEERMKHAPYSLMDVEDPSLPPHIVDSKINAFLAEDFHCLPLSCRRLRVRYPTFHAMRYNGARSMTALGLAAAHCIDFSERSHNQMRQDLRSDGKARSVTASSNRVFLRQAAAEHVDRGATDPVKTTVAEPPPSVAPKPKAAPKRVCQRGHGRQCWQNFRLQILKETQYSDRTIPPDILAAFYEKCEAEWLELPDNEKQHWEFAHTAEVSKRQQRHNTELLALEDEPPAAIVPVWSVGREFESTAQTEPPVVPLAKVAAHHARLPRRARRSKAFNDPMIIVTEAIPRPSLYTHPEDESLPVTGCFGKKTRCRRTIPLGRRLPFNNLVSMFNQWVDSLGDAKYNAKNLVLFRGVASVAIGPDHVVNASVLVLACRMSPKVQKVVPCAIKGTTQELFMNNNDFPIQFRPTVAPSKLRWTRRGLSICMSEDVCNTLAAFEGTWHLHPMPWSPGDDPLMDMRVDAFPGEYIAAKKTNTKRKIVVMPECLQGAKDPFAVGAATAKAMKHDIDEIGHGLPSSSGAPPTLAGVMPAPEVVAALHFDAAGLTDTGIDAGDDLIDTLDIIEVVEEALGVVQGELVQLSSC